MSNTTQPVTALFPFNQDSADIVLRTSDHVHYHVHSVILSQASPFFRDMFSLPQPGKPVPPEIHPSVDSEKPIVDITELSDTLYTLLILIYPVPKPPPPSFALIEAALAAAQKYELELPIRTLKNDLRAPASNLFGHTTLHVWAIACRLRLEDVAQYAASCLTHVGFDQLGDPGDTMLRGVSAGDYFRLMSFCQRDACDPRTSFKFAEPLKAELDGTSTPSGTTNAAFRTVPYPDALVRSSDGAEAPAHRCILATASSVLRDKLVSRLPIVYWSSLPVAGQYQSAARPLLVLQLDEPSDILWPLLDACCYSHVQRPELEQTAPSESPSLFMLTRMMAAAEKYEMIHGLAVLRARWHALARSSPLDAYLVAAEVGRTALAKDAARLVLNEPSTVCTQYSAELENAPALAYHRLLVYYNKCHNALKAELDVVKAQQHSAPGNRSVYVPPATGARERRWSFQRFLDNIGDSSRSGADGIISAAHSLLPEYIQWRSTETSLSSGSRQEAKNLHSLSQSLPMRLEDAIQKVELKL